MVILPAVAVLMVAVWLPPWGGNHWKVGDPVRVPLYVAMT